MNIISIVILIHTLIATIVKRIFEYNDNNQMNQSNLMKRIECLAFIANFYGVQIFMN